MDTLLRVLQVVPGTSVDGPGLRTSIYLAGCTHHCPGCHNALSWEFDQGTPMTVDELMAQIRAHDFNVTLTGGDPLQHRPLEAVKQLVRAIRAAGYTVWCYTGYTFEQLQTMPEMADLLPMFEALVDGPFVESLRDSSQIFRGSSNQRILRPDGTEAVGYQ